MKAFTPKSFKALKGADPGLRESLADLKAGRVGAVHTPKQIAARQQGKQDMATTKKWVGCATLNPDEPKLWIIPDVDPINETQGFSLAEVLEAGLRQKIVGLEDAERGSAISDCVADTLQQLSGAMEASNARIAELQTQLADAQGDTGRLEQALKLLGYGNAKELFHKSNLVHAMELFAGVTGDSDLAAECESEIQRIRAEVAAKQQSAK